jgi:ribosomal protein S1
MIKTEEFQLNKRYALEGTREKNLHLGNLAKLIKQKDIINGMVIKVASNGDLSIKFRNSLVAICKYVDIGIRKAPKLEELRDMVGKYYDFIITSKEDDKVYVSRRAIQEEVVEYFKNEVKPGTIIKARIKSKGRYEIFFDVGRGIRGCMKFRNIALNEFKGYFKKDDIIPVVFRGIYPNGKVEVSTMELYGDWEQNAALLNNYEARIGQVKYVADCGAFIILTPNIVGLADRVDGLNLKPGDMVRVVVRIATPEKMRVKLTVAKKLQNNCDIEAQTLLSEGRITYFEYEPESCVSKRRIEPIDYTTKSSLLEMPERQPREQDAIDTGEENATETNVSEEITSEQASLADEKSGETTSTSEEINNTSSDTE